VLAVGSLIIGRVANVTRPAFGNIIPTIQGSLFCLDLGANTDCKAEHLEQFAYMGSAYVTVVCKITHPRVVLLSNGHEAYKGSLAVKEAYAQLEGKSDINFVGNVEARDIFTAPVDVVVMDGFVGNVLLKSMQGTVRALFMWIKKETQKSLLQRILALCAKPLLKAVATTTDYQHIGGAILLGVKKPVIVAHGCSQAEALYNAILLAHTTVITGDLERVNLNIEQRLLSLREPQGGFKDASEYIQ
jgi:glycerol-3-phosphate acyltransferase PlsX